MQLETFLLISVHNILSVKDQSKTDTFYRKRSLKQSKKIHRYFSISTNYFFCKKNLSFVICFQLENFCFSPSFLSNEEHNHHFYLHSKFSHQEKHKCKKLNAQQHCGNTRESQACLFICFAIQNQFQ